jgi:hypothetical protein
MSSTELPPAWTVVTADEVVPGPIDIGMTEPRSNFARETTRVVNSAGQLVAASGDRDDAINQALSICQSTMVPYDSLTWPHP